MPKPYLLIVTGRPGAGKTTFARALGSEICMPVISRDQIKEGYVHTLGKSHAELPQEANGTATRIFFDTLKMLVAGDVSVIAEAAFQHRLWSSELEWFMDKARVFLLICKPKDGVAFDRYIKRGLNDPLREYFHGDKASVNPYDEPRIQAPTFYIDTSGEYAPSVQELAKAILEQPQS